MPYQQKPIDLFKAIFEASDSEDEADEEEVDASGKGGEQAADKPKAQAASLQPDTPRDPTEGAQLALQHFVPKKCYSPCWPSPATCREADRGLIAVSLHVGPWRCQVSLSTLVADPESARLPQ